MNQVQHDTFPLMNMWHEADQSVWDVCSRDIQLQEDYSYILEVSRWILV